MTKKMSNVEIALRRFEATSATAARTKAWTALRKLLRLKAGTERRFVLQSACSEIYALRAQIELLHKANSELGGRLRDLQKQVSSKQTQSLPSDGS